jgi:Methyltransferase domain
MLRALGALRQKTDYRRWAEPRNIYSSWESRTERAAELIPDGSSVIEFGAAKRVLERHLDPSCSYVPSDIVDRGPGTLIADLNNRPLPEIDAGAYDVAVFMGVLEYIRDLPAVVDWLAERVQTCVVSYACAPAASNVLRTLRGTVVRLQHGWMNSYNAEQLRLLFSDRGYAAPHEELWENQRLFIFSQQDALR